MHILVTGGSGRIGRTLVSALTTQGDEVSVFDAAPASSGAPGVPHRRGDVRDLAAVRDAVHAARPDAVLHLAAHSYDRPGPGGDSEVLSVNVQGTLNVLIAAAAAGVARVVHFSSVNALGCVGPHGRPPDRLPVGDDHPRRPQTAYQLSKHLSEEACRSFSDRHDLVTVSLRPVYVADEAEYKAESRGGTRAPGFGPEWAAQELWGYVDLRDVVRAAQLALQTAPARLPHRRHGAFLLAAADTCAAEPTRDLIARSCGGVRWGPGRSAADYLEGRPHRSLFDCGGALEALGWSPRHSWRDAAVGAGASAGSGAASPVAQPPAHPVKQSPAVAAAAALAPA